jgi:hypothetical protein
MWQGDEQTSGTDQSDGLLCQGEHGYPGQARQRDGRNDIRRETGRTKGRMNKKNGKGE